MLHGASLLALIVLLVIGLAAVSGRGESPIVARLGNVLYWTASLVAVAFLVLGGLVAILNRGPDGPFIAAIFIGIGVVAWLVGRACRYVLAGR
jgi:hypothetical protein